MGVPDVSIVVPTYGRPDGLTACLEGIASLDYGLGHFEVIVVDDGGPDNLDPVLAKFRDRIRLRLIAQANRGPGAARNAGAAVAKGRLLAFVDDDCVPAERWLSALVQELEAHPDRLLGGPVLNALPDNPFSTSTQLIATYVADYYAGGRARERFFTTNNIALSAERFRELEGFDTSIPSATAEDKEFCDRWRARGYEMGWVPAAVVHHAHDLTLWRFLRQHYNYGRGLLHFRLMRRQRGAPHLLPEPPSFYLNLILYPLRSHAARRGWRFVPLLILAQLATGAGAVKAALTEHANRAPESSKALEDVRRAGA
jgi:glycosyltransferase involved in cell wall biosynthesis